MNKVELVEPALVVLHPQGEVLFANAQACALAGKALHHVAEAWSQAGAQTGEAAMGVFRRVMRVAQRKGAVTFRAALPGCKVGGRLFLFQMHRWCLAPELDIFLLSALPVSQEGHRRPARSWVDADALQALAGRVCHLLSAAVECCRAVREGRGDSHEHMIMGVAMLERAQGLLGCLGARGQSPATDDHRKESRSW